MDSLPGKDIMVTFMEVDEEGGRLVLSARKRVDKSAKGLKARAWHSCRMMQRCTAARVLAGVAAAGSLVDALASLAFCGAGMQPQQ